MAQMIHQFTVTVPANTAVDDLYVVSLDLNQEVVVSLDLQVPPGPAGLMGFYLAMSGQQIIPFEYGEFFVWDNYYKTFILDGYPTANDWQVFAYNLDTANAHSIFLRFEDNPITATSTPTPTITVASGASLLEPVTL